VGDGIDDADLLRWFRLAEPALTRAWAAGVEPDNESDSPVQS
jgi:hypothetical protein